MLKALFKKQMLEVGKFIYFNNKTGTKRTGKSLISYSVLMIGILAMLGVMFFSVANSLCKPLTDANMQWMYFALMGLISIALGVFGSVFNTYAGLYQAKDNELLLSMPIPPKAILAARMLGVYIMGLVYETVVFVPTIVVYYINVRQTALSVIFSILMIFVLSFFVLTLSCFFGWIVAIISSKLKNKSIITVMVSIVFMFAYFYIYTSASNALKSVIQNASAVGEKIKHSIYPIYQMGMASQGSVSAMVIFTLMVAALLIICYLILSRSFIKIATTGSSTTKAKYKEKALNVSSAKNALLRKEFKRFTSSPIYMLNCALGTILMPIAAILVVIKSNTVIEVLSQFGSNASSYSGLIVCAAVCTISTMNNITSPSVSLEGKNIWIVQSFPIEVKYILMAKIKLHLLLTLIPALICTLCFDVVVKTSILASIATILCVTVFTVFSACIGLCLNLKMPNLTWTSETVPVKQSIGVMLSMFGGWAIVMVLGAIYFVLRSVINPVIYILLCTALLSILSALVMKWLNTTGAKIFSEL